MDSELDRKVARNVPKERPGRGMEAGGFHILAALPRIDGDPDGRTLGDGVADLVARVSAAWQGPRGPKLRLLPTNLPLEQVRAQAPEDAKGLLLGINERALAPVALDQRAEPHLLVYGDGRSGKSALVRTYIQELLRTTSEDEAQIILVDYRRANLGLVPEERLFAYCSTEEHTAELLKGLAGFLVKERTPGPDVTPQQLRDRSWWEGSDIYVIMDDYDLVSASQQNPAAPLVPLLSQASDLGLHVVVARRSGGAGRGYDPLISTMRDLAQPGILLSGDPSEGPLIGNVRPHHCEPGRAELITRDGGVQTIQVAWTEPVL